VSGSLFQAPLLPPRDNDEPLDLRELDLRGGHFQGAHLRDGNLNHARLELADLSGVCLQGARLVKADLTLANLSGADLRGADLRGADLSGADLSEADLSGADLEHVEFQWARLTETRGLPEKLRMRPRTDDGRVVGARLEGIDEPAAGMAAYQRGQRAHQAGELGEAERHYRIALAWVPDSDAARYGMGCVALERRDPDVAMTWWQQALSINPSADRARIDLAILTLAKGKRDKARQIVAAMADRADHVGAAVRDFLSALDDSDDPTAALQAIVPDSPALRWLARYGDHPPQARPPISTQDDVISRLSDEQWVNDERSDLEALIKTGSHEAWLWHTIIVRAVTIGAMDLAAIAEQRLSRVAPETRLWGIELKQLDLTGQAFEALVRTRRRQLGAIRSIRWVAIGGHGPTARVHCDGGEFYAKRYIGATRPAASVAYTHRICRTLSERGLDVPLPIGDRNGDDVMVFGDDLLAIYPDLGGRSIADEDIEPQAAGEVAAQLAHIHLLAKDLGHEAGRPPGGMRVGSRILRHRSPAGAWQLNMARNPLCAARMDQHPCRSRIASLLDAIGRRLMSVAEHCPRSLVHGDFGPGNVLVGSDANHFQIVDWDLCDVDLAVWDLARSIDRLSASWSKKWGAPVEIRSAVAAAMVRSYDAVRTLNPHEHAALPILIAASRVDLDASVLPICVPLEPEIGDVILDGLINRLSRAAAGAPEVAAALTTL
jgi:uncharacterized protein YjbI with pentapeptide repeats/Ser/Thr protein kinase RdoA (MazF antagonist)